MTGWHFIAVDLTDLWVDEWVAELAGWPARLERWARTQGVVAADEAELTSDPEA